MLFHWSGIKVLNLAQILSCFGLEIIALTRDSRGAALYVHGKEYQVQSSPVDVVDTVGAGDAFSKTVAVGVIHGADLKYTLQVACEVGAFVVQRQGAQVELPDELRGTFLLPSSQNIIGKEKT